MKAFLCILICMIFLFAEDKDRIINSSSPFSMRPHTIGIDAFHSIGFWNSIHSSIADIATGNPASLHEFNEPRFGLTLEYTPNIEEAPIEEYIIEYGRKQQYIPRTIGYLYPTNNYKIAIGYQKRYSNYEQYILDYFAEDSTNIVTIYENESNLHSFPLIFCYSFNNLIFTDDLLSLAVHGSIDYFRVTNNRKKYAEEFTGHWKMGLVYRLATKFSIGLIYENEISINAKVSQVDLLIYPDSLGTIYDLRTRNLFKWPNKLSYGFEYHVLDQLVLSSTFSHSFWENISSSYKNRLSFSGNVIYKVLNAGQALTVGFYKTSWNSNACWGEDAIFINFGIQHYSENPIVTIEYSDGYDGDWNRLRQYFVSFSIDYIFQ